MNGKAMVRMAKAAGLLLVGVALTVTSGCGGGGAKLESSKDFNFLPNNPGVIASFRVEEITKSPAYKDMMAEVNKMTKGKVEPMKEMEKHMGLSLDDVARFTVSVGDDAESPIMVFTTKKPVTASELTSKIKKESFSFDGKSKVENAKFTEVKVGSFTVQEIAGPGPSICVADANTVVMGEMKNLKPVLERNKAVELSADMKKALELADQSKAAFIVVNVKGMGKAKEELPKEAAQHTEKIDAFAIDIAFAGDAQVKLTALCKDAAAAEEIQKQANDGLKVAAAGIVMMPAEFKAIKDELSKAVEGVKINVSGNKLTGTAAVKPASILSIVGQFMGQATSTFKDVGPAIKLPEKE